MRFDLDVTRRGPVWARGTERAFDRLAEDIRFEVADQGAAEVGRETIVFRQPTGNYLRNITTTTRLDTDVVHLDEVVYDAWIEGTSERNKTTRFKGYKVFRRATQALDGRVDEIAAPLVRQFIRRYD